MNHHRLFGRSPLAAMALVLLGAATGRADRIVLRGGGEVRGVVIPEPGCSDRVLVQTEHGSAPVVFRKEQVAEVVPEPSALDDYLARREQAGPDAQAQYDLGLWCESKKLRGLADFHYRRAAELDKTFAPAHRKIGHVLHDGRWLTVDEARVAQGLLRYKGKWVTPEEKGRIDAREATAAEEVSWSRRLKLLRQSLLNGAPEHVQEAVGQLRAIRDPAAVSPLVKIFGQDPEPLRLVMTQALGAIPGAEASAALVARVLAEPEWSVREATLDELTRRPESETVPRLARALSSKSPEVVNRAAWALAGLNAVSVVPKLIPALVLVEYRLVLPPPDSASVDPPVGVSFSSVAPGPGLGSPGSYGLVSTPVVGAGVAAYSVSAVPTTYATGINLGGGVSRNPQPRFARVVHNNEEVLLALRKLTGSDFGYDVAAWRRWLSTSYHPEPVPARRIPQP